MTVALQLPGSNRQVEGSAFGVLNDPDGLRRFFEDLLEFLREFSAAGPVRPFTIAGREALPLAAPAPEVVMSVAAVEIAPAPAAPFRVPPYVATLAD